MLGSDTPMALGDHLDELRARLVRVVIVLVVVMGVAMSWHADLLAFVTAPLRRGANWISDETLAALGQADRAELSTLYNRNLTEGPVSVFKLSFYAAIIITFPYLVTQAWAFISPGLRQRERRFGFLLMPMAVMFFYGGLVFGYLVGLPFLYKFLFEFQASFNPGVRYEIQQSDFYGFFFMMCVVFGAIMDIPWALLTLVATRLVTPAQIAAKRRVIYLVAVVAAAVLTPPDPMSQIAVWVMVISLFEIGLLLARCIKREADEVAVANAAASGTEAAVASTLAASAAPAAASAVEEIPPRRRRDFPVASVDPQGLVDPWSHQESAAFPVADDEADVTSDSSDASDDNDISDDTETPEVEEPCPYDDEYQYDEDGNLIGIDDEYAADLKRLDDDMTDDDVDGPLPDDVDGPLPDGDEPLARPNSWETDDSADDDDKEHG
ncbi:MAG: twin-arginine translocase subunit TatC [Planctomycetota bacterium]|jgi:sec-independent protein translocase protein TatC